MRVLAGTVRELAGTREISRYLLTHEAGTVISRYCEGISRY